MRRQDVPDIQEWAKEIGGRSEARRRAHSDLPKRIWREKASQTIEVHTKPKIQKRDIGFDFAEGLVCIVIGILHVVRVVLFLLLVAAIIAPFALIVLAGRNARSPGDVMFCAVATVIAIIVLFSALGSKE